MLSAFCMNFFVDACSYRTCEHRAFQEGIRWYWLYWCGLRVPLYRYIGFTGTTCIGGYPARAFVMWKSGYWTGINNTYPLLSTRRVPAWSPMRALPAHSFPPLCSTSLLPSVGLTLFVAAICFKHWCKHCKTPSSPSTGAKLSKASSNLLNIE